ncbi:hypothetical protein ACGFX2_38930 [Streptomyces goshikiensis]|uniref:hypothetical protein n=1 Tax=Streptomyces goshikiensis TaxID=1942 RepID=UPI0037241429
MALVQNLVPGILGGVSGLAQALMGAPAWVIVACLALSLGLGGLQAVFPQDSADRLAWWEGQRAYLLRRRELRDARSRERQLGGRRAEE